MSAKPSTPLPWSVFEHRDHSGIGIGPRYTDPVFKYGEVRHVCNILSLSGTWPRSMSKEQQADAAYIVTACNAYPQLVAALRDLWRVSYYANSPDEMEAASALLRSLGEEA